MVVHISDDLVEALRRQAHDEARGPDELVDNAVREFLISSSITDLSAEQIGDTQMAISSELRALPYEGSAEDGHETR